MKLRYFLFAAALAVITTQARAQGFSDTWIGVRDGTTHLRTLARRRAGATSTRSSSNVGHFDVWDYGSNFFNVDTLFSNANEPANNSAGGSTEFYAVYRGQLSPDKISRPQHQVRTDSRQSTSNSAATLESENTTFAPDKKLHRRRSELPYRPAGRLPEHRRPRLSKEWNNNGICDCTGPCSRSNGGTGRTSTTAEFEFVWLFADELHRPATGLPGFHEHRRCPKGKDGFGNKTATEVLARPQLSIWISATLMFNKPHKPDVYFAVELWEQ